MKTRIGYLLVGGLLVIAGYVLGVSRPNEARATGMLGDLVEGVSVPDGVGAAFYIPGVVKIFVDSKGNWKEQVRTKP